MKVHSSPSRFALSGLAQIVLAVATGLPLRSVDRLVPAADDRHGPFLGV